jgi:inorganic pyrophosphatase
MSNVTIGAGKDVPNDLNVIIEIPAQSSPVKYEFDKDTGMMMVDRFMATCMFYPCDYGYIPDTLAEDGDAVDVLVMAPNPLIAGSCIRVRPVGMLNMEDESGMDAKVLAVPVDKLSKIYSDVKDLDDVPPLLKQQIQHFFEHYKDLEAGKWVKVIGWEGPDAAKKEILAGIERANKA